MNIINRYDIDTSYITKVITMSNYYTIIILYIQQYDIELHSTYCSY